MSARAAAGPSAPVLLVEGPTDWHFIAHLTERPKSGASYAVYDCTNKDELLKLIRPTVLAAQPASPVGMLLDADDDVAARWRAVGDKLRGLGYNLPRRPETGGTIRSAPGCCDVGIWLLPDNELPGTLEHLAERLIAPHDPLLLRAKSAVDGIPEAERKFGPTDVQKACIHTWLAWQEEPGTPLGQAVTKTYLDRESDLAAQLRQWLTRLFGP